VRPLRLTPSRQASRFGLSRSGGIRVRSLLHARRRSALRHDDFIAIGGGRRDQRGRQVATARRTCAGFDVVHSRRGLYGSRSRCTTCRGKHRCRCGGYQKIQLPHITNVAPCIRRASSPRANCHVRMRHSVRALGAPGQHALRCLRASQTRAGTRLSDFGAGRSRSKRRGGLNLTRRGRAPASCPVEIAAKRQSRARR
jgi:hypothetical protein